MRHLISAFVISCLIPLAGMANVVTTCPAVSQLSEDKQGIITSKQVPGWKTSYRSYPQGILKKGKITFFEADLIEISEIYKGDAANGYRMICKYRDQKSYEFIDLFSTGSHSQYLTVPLNNDTFHVQGNGAFQPDIICDGDRQDCKFEISKL